MPKIEKIELEPPAPSLPHQRRRRRRDGADGRDRAVRLAEDAGKVETIHHAAPRGSRAFGRSCRLRGASRQRWACRR